MKLIAVACAFALLLSGVYVALGGATYKPLDAADPCDAREPPAGEERGALEQVVISALDGAACELRVTREELALALLEPEARAEFAERQGLSEEELDDLVKAGLERAVDDAESRDELSAFEAGLLSQAIGVLPVATAIDVLSSSAGRDVIDVIQDLLGAA
jgi:hypothetical protein